MATKRYYFDDGKTRKFWSISKRGKSVVTCSGNLGTNGRKVAKEFPASADATAAAKKQIESRVKKGYVLVDPTLAKFQKIKGSRKATESQVAKLEKLLEAKLPRQYRNFLLTQNGGRPEKGDIEVFGRTWSRYRYIAWVNPFYTLRKNAPSYESLLDVLRDCGPTLPKGQLPIADSGSNLITIDLLNKVGCIYYFDHELPMVDLQKLVEMDEAGTFAYEMEHATLLAGSFDELLTRIAVYEETDD